MARWRGGAALVAALGWLTAPASAQPPAVPSPVLAPPAAPTRAPQTVIGGFDDASLPRAGEARVRFGIVFEATSEQFGGATGLDGSTRVPLGARFAYDSINGVRFPFVGGVQTALRDSLGVSGGLTLGTATTDYRTLVSRVPFQIDYGVTRRITLGVLIPIVRTLPSVQLRTNPGGTTGNLGFNPANAELSTDAVAGAALQQNARVQTQLAAAASRLEALIAACPTTGTPSARPECANRAAATQLVTSTRTVANGIAQVYGAGTTARPGALVVPIQGTDPHRAVEQRLRALGTQYATYQVDELASPFIPSPATARIATAGLQRILTDELFAINSDSVRSVGLQGTGDVELSAHAMWLDTFGGPADGFRVRSTVGAGYRLATGSDDLAFLMFDVPTGSGGPSLLLRSATDLAVGSRLWVSAVARVETSFSRDVAVRVPFAAGELFAPSGRELVASRRSGRRVELELTPRWTPNETLALAAQYRLRTKSADQFTGSLATTDATGAPVDVDASILGVGTGGTAHLAGFGVTYSTLGSYARRRAAFPVEVSFLHNSTLTGSGGAVPKTRYDQLSIRFYTQILGAGTRRAPEARR